MFLSWLIHNYAQTTVHFTVYTAFQKFGVGKIYIYNFFLKKCLILTKAVNYSKPKQYSNFMKYYNIKSIYFNVF